MKLAPKLLAAAVLAALSTPAFAEITIDVIGGSEVSFEGLIQMDGNWFDNDITDLNGVSINGDDTEFELRRAEIVLKGKGPGNWNWVVGYDAKADKFLDTNVQYRFNAQTFLTVGQYKQPNSLEELSSTKNNDFISKAMTTNLQGVARRMGVQLAYLQTNWGITGSAYGDELTRNLAQGPGYGVRGYFAPINESGNFLHLGLSYNDFEAEDANGNASARFRVRPDADLATARLVDTGNFADADRIATTGFEAAYVNGPVKVQAEYMTSDISRDLNPDFSGDSWYVYGVWNVTGETWGYRNGVITTGLPDDPASGMWQVGLRYDTVDLNDGLVRGGTEDNWTVGVNWYWRSNYKFSANYVMVDADRQGLDQSPNIFELRAQFYW
ncbi:OprO/OprP family phosphate-selective porin [Arenimonas sp. MALMAid1274]|uniref:OprO/OprP family phosphate-selective porin n=1 Tax=Arenimonas sp. MALMAid1274 TaxID=3411630 RepID=UPI003B9E79FA